MNKRVAELLDSIRIAEVELLDIRSKCEHPSYFVGLWSWRAGSYYPSRICNECQIAIPGITEDERMGADRQSPYSGNNQ